MRFDHVNSARVLNHVWELGAGAETLNIKNIEVEIASGTVDEIYIPENGLDWLTCESGDDNNPFTFLKADPNEGYIFTLYDGDASLDGPGTPAYAGSADFTSSSLNCTTCSTISTEETQVGVWIHGLTLDTAAPAVVSNGTNSTTIDRSRIALIDKVHASAVGSLLYEIDPGAALFVVTASADGQTSIETIYNSTAIELEMEPPMLLDPSYYWIVSPFELTYEDDNEGEWTLSIGTLFFTP